MVSQNGFADRAGRPEAERLTTKTLDAPLPFLGDVAENTTRRENAKREEPPC
jgi:hypothetical protein